MAFKELKSGQKFASKGSKWVKRQDNLGADLLGRDGGISFIGGRRHIVDFPPDAVVTPL